MKLISFLNLGNTCYLNSVLQCFINDKTFQEFIKNNEKDLFDLKNLIKFIDHTSESENKLSCCKLHYIINKIKNDFKLFQQHDAHEFLTYFLDKIDFNINCELKVEIKCNTCNSISKTFEIFNTINFYVNNDSIHKLFMDYLKSESIDNYFCEKCNCETVAEKRSHLTKLSNHLIIVLKKYNSKNKIDYSSDLKIKIDDTIRTYQLTSVINHLGNEMMGHYNCNIKINDNWFFMDDDTIFLNEKMTFDNLNAYILFYKLK